MARIKEKERNDADELCMCTYCTNTRVNDGDCDANGAPSHSMVWVLCCEKFANRTLSPPIDYKTEQTKCISRNEWNTKTVEDEATMTTNKFRKTIENRTSSAVLAIGIFTGEEKK